MKILKTLRLDDELIAEIEARAKAEHRTFTNMVTVILEEWRSKKTKAA